MGDYVLSILEFNGPFILFLHTPYILPFEEIKGNIFRVRLTKYKGRNIVPAVKYKKKKWEGR